MPSELKKRIFSLLLEIPKGKATTYRRLAEIAGTHPRVVAKILSSNREPDKYPCYKVVRSDGSVSGYVLGVDEKILRLKKEGIPVRNGKVPKEFLL